MKTKQVRIIAITALFLTVVMTMPVWASENKEEAAKPTADLTQPQTAPASVKMVGTILANKNDKGKIVNYELQEDNGQSVILSQHGSGMELRRMVGKKIEATGTLYESKGEKTIIVKEFKKIE